VRREGRRGKRAGRREHGSERFHGTSLYAAFASRFPRYRRLTVALLVAAAAAGATSIGFATASTCGGGYGYGYGYGYQYGPCENPHLIVIKHVVNDSGGSAVAANFSMQINGVTVTGANPFPGEESPGTLREITPGNYNVTETGPSGYTASFSAGCSGSIDFDETKTCTVTNDDQQAHLIVIKHVINDSGGSATASAFTMKINGITATGGNQFAGAESPGTDKSVTPGSYNVTETGPAGYVSSFSADCTGTIALGQTKTCTVTNNDAALPHTIGYWKNHQAATTAQLPQKLGNYTVATFADATAVFNKANCSSKKDNDAIGCLAGQLLAAKLAINSGASTCISPTVAKADSFLSGGTVTVGGKTASGVNYTGPSGTYTLNATQRAIATSLANALDKYNNNKGCTNP
jgi:hypothetical protein